MPELPEVEVVRRGLAHWTTGRDIVDVQVLHPRAVRRHVGPPSDFEAVVRGAHLSEVHRRGKFLWWPLPDVALVGHLGMSGQFRVDGEPGEHTRILFDIEDGRLRNLEFIGGCNGNLQGLGRLTEGMDVDEVISKLQGIRCGMKQTSCPDQLSRALIQAKEKLAAQKAD